MSNKKRKMQQAQEAIKKNAAKKDEGCGCAKNKITTAVISAIALCAIILGVIFGASGCTKNYTIEMSVRNYGIITLELDGSAAPKTVKNFVSLVEDGFYDGLTFHRVMENFMIQGGDPNRNGTGSGPKTIVGEFSENGYNNPISHERGVISMARGDDPDSASCQFFICNADSTFLDGKHAAFGRVTSGMEVVDAITADFGYWDGVIYVKDSQPVIEYIKVIK